MLGILCGWRVVITIVQRCRFGQLGKRLASTSRNEDTCAADEAFRLAHIQSLLSMLPAPQTLAACIVSGRSMPADAA
jgi:hypothetical protein